MIDVEGENGCMESSLGPGCVFQGAMLRIRWRREALDSVASASVRPALKGLSAINCLGLSFVFSCRCLECITGLGGPRSVK